MDVYSLINSKAISEHCRKIKHEFNTEEIAVLIYRNKRMNIEEKIKAYKELIEQYPDMPVIERINCDYYDSVKDMIEEEIYRIETLSKKLRKNDKEAIYTYNYYWNNYWGKIIEGRNELNTICKTYGEIKSAICKEIEEDEETGIFSFRITKKSLSKEDIYEIGAEYIINKDRKLELVNIYDFKGDWLNISNICLNIPTPFKKGDLLISNSKTPFSEGHVLSYDKFPFVLVHLCNWDKKFQERLLKGNHDSSDMQGPGYLISDEGNIYCDNVFDYDCWEYFDGELNGMEQILKGISSLMKDKIGIDTFIDVYENLKAEDKKLRHNLEIYTEEGLQLAGVSDEQIKKMN